MIDITLKDQYIYLVSTATLMSEEEKQTLIAELEKGMTPALQEKLIHAFQAESDSIDESIQNLHEAKQSYGKELYEAETEASSDALNIDTEIESEMSQVEKEAITEMDTVENEYAKAIEGDARQADSSQMDAIRQQLGIQK